MTESWLPIPGYEGIYEVSDFGRVRRLRHGIQHTLVPSVNPKGYMLVTLYLNGKTTARVHRLVLEAFIGARPPGHEASHQDGNPENNMLSNLRWETRRENHRKKWVHGTAQAGEAASNVKLTSADVLAIREAAPHQTRRALAKRYGVAPETIYKIARRVNWRHLAGEDSA